MDNEDGFIVIWNGEGEDGESDIFGQLFSLNTVSTIKYQEEEKIIISPNPVGQYLYMEIKNRYPTLANCTVLDVNGKVLLQQSHQILTGQNELHFNIESLPTGQYFLQIQTEEGIEHRKFVKQ
ncbi:MAG: T9SS type A sorting domain-containing protein [Bacteroidota bacterium]